MSPAVARSCWLGHHFCVYALVKEMIFSFLDFSWFPAFFIGNRRNGRWLRLDGDREESRCTSWLPHTVLFCFSSQLSLIFRFDWRYGIWVLGIALFGSWPLVCHFSHVIMICHSTQEDMEQIHKYGRICLVWYFLADWNFALKNGRDMDDYF